MNAKDSILYESWTQRVVFSLGSATTDTAAEVAQLGARRVLLVASESRMKVASEITRGIPVVATFTKLKPHVPREVALGARQAARECGADLLLCVGGGSTTGAAKAVALTERIPIVAVPTTYAGSEATPVWGLTDGQKKTTGIDAGVLPRAVIYDADLMMSLPAPMAVASGLNAFAHCVDSWWAPRTNPISSALAAEGACTLSTSLPRIVANGTNRTAHSMAHRLAHREVLIGTYLAAVAFAGAGSGLHHRICHVLGGAFDLDHSALHAVMLPHVAGLNLAASPTASARIGAALGVALTSPQEAFDALVEFYARLNAPSSLRELGLTEDGLGRATHAIMDQIPASNPRRLEGQQVSLLLRRAFRGEVPCLVPMKTPCKAEATL